MDSPSPLPPPLPALPQQGRPGWVRASLLIYALIVLALPLEAYIEENCRGAWLWWRCQRALDARGEHLDVASFVPAQIPEATNLALGPFFTRVFQYRRTEASGGELTFGPNNPDDAQFGIDRPNDAERSGVEYARHCDLPAYQRAIAVKAGAKVDPAEQPADAVLRGLAEFAPQLDELARDAAERPLSRFPVTWEDANPPQTRLLHLHVERKIIQTLSLRASANLAKGRVDEAARDVALCLRLCRDMNVDPCLTGCLTQQECVLLALRPIWEGLADRQWSDAQLQTLERDLGSFGVIDHLATMLRAERAFGVKSIEFVKNSPRRGQAAAVFSDVPPRENVIRFNDWLFKFEPDGWFDLNKVSVANCLQDYQIAAVDPRVGCVWSARLERIEPTMNRLRSSRINTLAKEVVFSFWHPIWRIVKGQTLLDEAMTACALERHFLEHGAYPAQLAALAPAYLARVPADVIDGGALHYSTTPDGRYRLYSIGWDETDDGGRNTTFEKDGDWVWQYTPPPAPERKPQL